MLVIPKHFYILKKFHRIAWDDGVVKCIKHSLA
jgi:hypothetical protein